MTPSRMMTRQKVHPRARDLPGGGRGGWDLHVNTLPETFAVTAVCLVLFSIFNDAVVATARAHAAVARGLHVPAEDPLREAKEVLGRPGLLSSNLRA